MKLSILMPVYNEVRTLPGIITRIIALGIDKELIIVDDCSSDGSRELIEREYRNRQDIKVILHSRNMGKGAAIKTALSAASGELAIIQDADMEYDPHDYLKLIEALQRNGADAVYGSRFLGATKATTFWHFLVNKFFTEMTNLLFGCRLTDMETCYKLIKTGVFRGLDIQSPRFEIEAEITAKLIKKGSRILEVPISYKGRSYHEGKKITWKDGLVTLIAMFKYRFF